MSLRYRIGEIEAATVGPGLPAGSYAEQGSMERDLETPTNKHEVFLSHASSDEPLVERIAFRLREAGVTVWLDKWSLVPGESWQRAIEDALRNCASIAVFIGPQGLGSWHEEEIRAAIQCRVSEAQPRVIPVLLPGATPEQRDKLPLFLKATTWVEYPTEEDEEAIRRLICGIRGLPPGPTPTGAAAPVIKKQSSDVDAAGERLASGNAQLKRLLYPPYEPPPTISAAGAQSLAALLKPRHQEKIPFIGRIKERSELMAWANRTGSGLRVRLCIGAGGQGKTRLAAEFAMELEAKGWLVGFVPPSTSAEELGQALGASDALLVVDYAGRRVDQVVALLNAAESRRSGRTALLLLERSRGEWWTDLEAKLQGTRGALDAVTFAETLHLGPLPEADRAEMLGAASAAYGRGSSAALPRDDNALSVQIAALLGISGDREELLKELLKRESRYWRQMATAHNLSAEPVDLATAVALATLVRPNENQARRLLKLAFERPGQLQVRRTLAWLSELYPGENSSIGALAPDRVGEALIAEQLETRPRLLGGLLERLDGDVAANVFDALARTCSSHPRVVPLVSAALRKMSQQLWAVAVRTAPMLDETFARLLTETFEAAPAIPYGPILKALPESTICLRELAASANQREVLKLREKRRAAGASVDAYLPDLATSLNNLSIRLAALGRREEGLQAVQEAVETYRKLAQAKPDAFLPYLATSLNNLSIRLAALGRREEGLQAVQEAVETYRKLAQAKPDAFLPDLALSLNSFSNRLGELGRPEEGLQAVQEAVETYRKLAQARPDAFLPDLAMSLNNLSIRLGELGRPEEGLQAVQEAVGTYRKLAQARPDAFPPYLANALDTLSGRMGELRRPEDGLQAVQEAVEIFRKLAQATPDAFLPGLANALGTLSERMGELGRPEDGVQAMQEAVETYRKLAQATPDAFLPRLANSLNTLADLLRKSGRHDEAQRAAEEAAALNAPRPNSP